MITVTGDYGLYDVVTSSTWTARSGEQMGQGRFRFAQATLAGQLSGAGLPEFEGFNFTGGTVPSGIRGVVAKISGTYRLVSADCSGGA